MVMAGKRREEMDVIIRIVVIPVAVLLHLCHVWILDLMR